MFFSCRYLYYAAFSKLVASSEAQKVLLHQSQPTLIAKMTKTSTSLHAFLTNTKHYDHFFEPLAAEKFSRNWFCIAVLLLLGALASEVSAQANPNGIAGLELQRQQERERLLRDQLERTPDVRVLTGMQDKNGRLPELEAPCFHIRQIVLKSEVATFDWALLAADVPGDPATGRCLGSTGINLVMSRIQNAIVERGYVTTRILAEAQDLQSGVLTLTVIPGRIRAIRFSNDSGARANTWNAIPAQPGDLLNLRDIEQALENFKRVPTAEADIEIVPADELGESDLVITWKQAFPLRLTLSANDGGARTTGKYQGNVTVSGDHLLALNDLFYASFNHDLGGGESGERGTHGHTLHYSLPWGYWMLGATTGTNRYHQLWLARARPICTAAPAKTMSSSSHA
jgi:hemolysin activation/secretion protein